MSPPKGGCRKRLIILHRVRQAAANDMYYKSLSFELLDCQPELVEDGVLHLTRLRQAQVDNLIIRMRAIYNTCH